MHYPDAFRQRVKAGRNGRIEGKVTVHIVLNNGEIILSGESNNLDTSFFAEGNAHRIMESRYGVEQARRLITGGQPLEQAFQIFNHRTVRVHRNTVKVYPVIAK